MRCLTAALMLLAAVSASAQVVSRPTEPPIVTAENDGWYRLREPVLFAGDAYYPAGARVFFNGNTMVRTGHYNGVPLYADTTVEPHSPILVPVGRGLMQPYERVRGGGLAGIWLRFMGATWISAGPAVPLRASEFVQVGEHAGFPVYARKGLEEDRIYLPSPGGVIPFKLKE